MSQPCLSFYQKPNRTFDGSISQVMFISTLPDTIDRNDSVLGSYLMVFSRR